MRARTHEPVRMLRILSAQRATEQGTSRGHPGEGERTPARPCGKVLQPKPSRWAEGGKEALWNLGACGVENLQGGWEVTVYGDIKT